MWNEYYEKISLRGKTRKGTFLRVCGFTLIILVVSLSSCYELMYKKSGYLDFILHKSKYDRLVALAKQHGVAPGKSDTLPLPAALKPPLTYPGDATGRVLIVRDERGAYTISIVTADHDHGGVFGYVYSDASSNNQTSVEETTMFESLDLPITPHWWTASNTLL